MEKGEHAYVNQESIYWFSNYKINEIYFLKKIWTHRVENSKTEDVYSPFLKQIHMMILRANLLGLDYDNYILFSVYIHTYKIPSKDMQIYIYIIKKT